MSLNITPLPIVKVLDPRVRVNNERVYAVTKGAQEVSYQPFPSTSFNNSQAQITCNPPSRDTIINRKVWINATFSLTFGGTSGTLGTLLVPGQYDGLRCQPLAQIFNTIMCTVNNDQISANFNQYSTAMQRYHNDDILQNRDDSMSPSMPDSYQQYSDWEIFGSGRNPLAYFGENSAKQSRGGFSGLSILTNTSTSATATVNITEPVYLSPFLWQQHHDESGFIGVQNMSFTFTMGNLLRIWSHSTSNKSPAPQGTITSLTVNLTGIQVLLNYLTPQIGTPLPRAISYPYAEITPYPTQDGSNLGAGSARTLQMNSVQLKTIPRRMYVYARQADQSIDASVASSVGHSDTFAVINSIAITFNNRVGLLSTATQQDLYQISVKNGCNLNWNEFTNNVGSVLCIDFGLDLGLPMNECPGIVGNYQLQMQVNITNTSASSTLYSLYVVVVNEGTYSMIDGSTQHAIGVVSHADCLNANNAPEMPYQKAKHVYGGSFWDKIKSGFQSVGRFLKEKAWPVLKPLASKGLDFLASKVPVPLVGTIARSGIRHLTGVGVSGGKMRKSKKKCHMVKSHKVKAHKVKRHKACSHKRGRRRGGEMGGVLLGGELMSTSDLKQRLEDDVEDHGSEGEESDDD